METISQQITSLYQSADEKGRKSIQDAIRDLMFSFDSDFDVFLRIASGVRHPNHHLIDYMLTSQSHYNSPWRN